MWILPFDLRHVLDLGETYTSQHEMYISACLSMCTSCTFLSAPLRFMSCRGGLCTCHGCQPVGATWSIPLRMPVPGTRSSGLGKCWSHLDGPWLALINGGFHCSQSYIIWRKCMTQTWHNLQFYWNVASSKRYFQMPTCFKSL